jgi:hypothetical protein
MRIAELTDRGDLNGAYYDSGVILDSQINLEEGLNKHVSRNW